MPNGTQARRLAASSEISAAVTAIRCALELLDGSVGDGRERYLLRVIDDELTQIRRAAEHLGAERGTHRGDRGRQA
jgi:hypothetical protein